MKTCPKCNRSNDDDSLFCAGCGSRLDSQEKTFCTHCGNEVSPDAVYCNKCGYGVNGKEIILLEKRITPQTKTFECMCFYNGFDGTKGMLTIMQEGICFHAKSGLMGPGLDYALPMSNIYGFCLVRFGINRCAKLSITTRDGGEGIELGGPKIIGQGENECILTTIAYIIELYRRYYWSYVAPTPVMVYARPSYNDDRLHMENVTDEQLFNKVGHLI